MDRRERVFNQSETLKIAMKWKQAQIWTALPGIVAKYPGTAGLPLTIDVQPTINGLLTDRNGDNSWVQMPVLMDCPLMFQGGGGVTATFPVAAGDECLVVFASRCIDNWFQQGGPQNQGMLRMHDLSDGFAFVGVRSIPRAYTLDTANACLITDDGNTYFKLNPTTKAVKVQASGGINLNGCTIDANGNFTSPATITGQTDLVTGAGVSVNNHIHPGVQSGGSNTGKGVG